MDDIELRQRLETLEKQTGEVHALAQRLYRIILWTVIVSVVVFVLPLVGIAFEIPSLINTYATIGSIH